jgi:dTDP-4-dehydrorhamnose 3,5-epimerase
MNITKTDIEGLLVIEPDVYSDSRGCFYESYNSKKFILNNLEYFFVQDNEAESTYGVIRGLHFQREPKAQTKLVRVNQGEVLDVAIDLRKNSKTYGQVFSIILSQKNKKQLLIPRGFAHGYSVLSPTSVFNYKCDNYYSKEHESGIHPFDEHFQIDWKIPADQRIVSDKDLALPFFQMNSKS